ncbi:MAG: lytic transglycosylase domain-containing protein [Rubrivivax sp.]
MPEWRAAVAAAWAAAACSGASAQVWVGPPPAEGQGIVLTNFESREAPVLLIEAPPSPAAPLAAVAAPPAATPGAPTVVGAAIDEAARRHGVSAALLHAVIATESAFDSRAVSPKGALGLMQLLPETAARFGVRQPFDVRENVQGGAQYLRWLADRFGGRIDLVLAAYNAGEGTVVRSGYRVPDIAETRAYVRNVLRRVQCSALDRCTAAPPA